MINVRDLTWPANLPVEKIVFHFFHTLSEDITKSDFLDGEFGSTWEMHVLKRITRVCQSSVVAPLRYGVDFPSKLRKACMHVVQDNKIIYFFFTYVNLSKHKSSTTQLKSINLHVKNELSNNNKIIYKFKWNLVLLWEIFVLIEMYAYNLNCWKNQSYNNSCHRNNQYLADN